PQLLAGRVAFAIRILGLRFSRKARCNRGFEALPQRTCPAPLPRRNFALLRAPFRWPLPEQRCSRRIPVRRVASVVAPDLITIVSRGGKDAEEDRKPSVLISGSLCGHVQNFGAVTTRPP